MNNIRQKALFIIDNVYNKGAFLEEQLNIFKQSNISDRDFTFVKNITTGVIRNRTYLDYVIKINSKIRFKKIHKIIAIILEMAIFQCYFLDKIPNYSIVDESVKLAKLYGNKGSSSFVNAILRNIVSKDKEVVKIEDSIENLSVYYSHPKFYTKYFYENYGVELTKNLLKANNQESDFVIRVNTLKTKKDNLSKLLKDENFNVRDGLVPDSLIIENPKNIFDTQAFREGFFYAQDFSSIKVSQILNPRKYSKILDLCAAPGGKSTHLGALLENTGQIVACDKSWYKLDLIRENAKRLGVSNIKVSINDASKYNNDFEDKFDYCLVDAPCSAIGLYRKKPDIKWNRSLDDIKNLAQIQKIIINNAGRYVKKGGVLIYSTCSLSYSENEGVIKEFLDRNKNYKILTIEGKDILKLFPFDNYDGFSICKLQRLY